MNRLSVEAFERSWASPLVSETVLVFQVFMFSFWSPKLDQFLVVKTGAAQTLQIVLRTTIVSASAVGQPSEK